MRLWVGHLKVRLLNIQRWFAESGWMGRDELALARLATARALEGVVARKDDAPYRARRTRSWLKVKTPAFKAGSKAAGTYTEVTVGKGGVLTSRFSESDLDAIWRQLQHYMPQSSRAAVRKDLQALIDSGSVTLEITDENVTIGMPDTQLVFPKPIGGTRA
jgi:hypothetical protein